MVQGCFEHPGCFAVFVDRLESVGCFHTRRKPHQKSRPGREKQTVNQVPPETVNGIASSKDVTAIKGATSLLIFDFLPPKSM